jgi:tRNA pseudouridine55 synthase
MDRGIFGIYKEKGITSHDVVDRIRKLTGEKKVGHAGTLDPLARGVLVVGLGRENTKKLGSIVKKEKEYLAEIKLGENSTTCDEEGEKQKIKITKIPDEDEIKKTLKSFIGFIMQRPPLFSAVKIKGIPAYKLARAKQSFELKERKVEIKDIELINYEWPHLKIKVTTGPGVYIRSLAQDIGKKINTGGYLKELERTRVGQFTKQSCVRL